ncbi:hypothetical protein [Nesterenkonia alkaliphila]|uniref:Lipoprotein n=1 Tax=Nesterenkonia alkaliphila TaxID=1463631 RepID=A0A7K1ULI6_9MICC|nr:hypothetical protein [Nesterenkonia alkaliphila]MVT27284.1 hypothetical protein [Nesterenkonia alkaliphila]GFZ82297.1 hypothetical protein GCM10011359_08760 [Nesterenkonia alkaliphila]
MSTLTTRSKTLGGAAGVFGLLAVTACGGSSVEAYCDVWEEGQAEFEQLETADMQNFDEAFSTVEDFLDDAVSAAPDEIESQTENLRDAIAAINNLDIDFENPESFTDPEVMEDLEQLEEQFATIEADSQAVEDYVNENCENVDLS